MYIYIYMIYIYIYVYMYIYIYVYTYTYTNDSYVYVYIYIYIKKNIYIVYTCTGFSIVCLAISQLIYVYLSLRLHRKNRSCEWSSRRHPTLGLQLGLLSKGKP